MLTIVEKGKTFYIGARKFVEGDVIPPSVNQGVEIIINREPIIEEPEEIKKPKRKYRSRKGSVV